MSRPADPKITADVIAYLQWRVDRFDDARRYGLAPGHFDDEWGRAKVELDQALAMLQRQTLPPRGLPETIESMSDEGRLALFEELDRRWCMDCGREQKSGSLCQCQNVD